MGPVIGGVIKPLVQEVALLKWWSWNKFRLVYIMVFYSSREVHQILLRRFDKRFAKKKFDLTGYYDHLNTV